MIEGSERIRQVKVTSREPPAEDEWEELEQRGGVREDSRRKRVLLRLSVEGIGREERGNFEKRVDGLKKGDGWRTWTWKRAIAAAVGMRGKSRLVPPSGLLYSYGTNVGFLYHTFSTTGMISGRRQFRRNHIRIPIFLNTSFLGLALRARLP